MDALFNPFEGSHPFRGKKDGNSTPKKRKSTAENINEQIVSIPRIFSPPRVVSTQINRKKSRKSTVKQVHENSAEQDITEGERKASLLLEEFSSMLEESSTTLDKSPFRMEESSSYLESIHSMHEETVKLPSKREEPVSLQDKFSSMLEDDESFEEKFSSIHEESSPFQEEISPMLKKSYSEKVESLLTLDKSSPKRDDQKQQSPIVKLPVLLANVNIDIDVFETFDLLFPLENVINIEWSIQSFDCSVILPSSTVFLKGVLIADIECSNKGNASTLHIVKLPISWMKTTDVDWLSLPELSRSSQSEFMFQSPLDKEVSSHDEFHQEFTGQIDNNLRNIHFVWHQELCSQLEIQKLHIEGVAYLSIDLLQSQYVELPSLGHFQ